MARGTADYSDTQTPYARKRRGWWEKGGEPKIEEGFETVDGVKKKEKNRVKNNGKKKFKWEKMSVKINSATLPQDNTTSDTKKATKQEAAPAKAKKWPVSLRFICEYSIIAPILIKYR